MSALIKFFVFIMIVVCPPTLFPFRLPGAYSVKDFQRPPIYSSILFFNHPCPLRDTDEEQVRSRLTATKCLHAFANSIKVDSFSFNLPVAFQAEKVQAGTWNAILEIDPVIYKRELSVLNDKNKGVVTSFKAKGARYCVSIHSFSNLRMKASVTQNAYEPGSTLTLRAILTEYNQPVERRATVKADLEYPDHTMGVLSLDEIQPGVFETTLIATMPGIYRFIVQAKGGTYKGVPFTREEMLNAAVFHDIHNVPSQPSSSGKDDWCRLLACLLSEKNVSDELESRLKREGINLDGIRECVKAFCRG